MPSPQQQALNSGEESGRSTVTTLPASALKHLEPAPGGQWMCREYQGALHVAYSLVGGHGTYHYLINPCTTERQVHDNCRSHIYEYPGAQRNHEEIQRYEFPDRFNSTTRATSTMQVIMEPQSLALNNVARIKHANQNAETKLEDHYVENLMPREREAIAQAPNPRLTQHDSSEEIVSQPETLPGQTTQILSTEIPAAGLGSWSFGNEMVRPATAALSGQPLTTGILNTNQVYTNSTWPEVWDTTAESNSGGTEFGWLMNVAE